MNNHNAYGWQSTFDCIEKVVKERIAKYDLEIETIQCVEAYNYTELPPAVKRWQNY